MGASSSGCCSPVYQSYAVVAPYVVTRTIWLAFESEAAPRKTGRTRRPSRHSLEKPIEKAEVDDVILCDMLLAKDKAVRPVQPTLSAPICSRGLPPTVALPKRVGPEFPMVRGLRPPVNTPFGKRLHWVGPCYKPSDQTTIFARECSDGRHLNIDLLENMFAIHKHGQRESKCLRKQKGVCLFSNVRAQNIGVVLSKLPFNPEDVLANFQKLDFTRLNVQSEDVALLLKQLPNEEEARLLLAHADHPEKLRDIKRRMLSLCMEDWAEKKHRLLHIFGSHRQDFERLSSRLEVVCRAAQEVMCSTNLAELLSFLLETGNYINYGRCDTECATATVSCSARFF